MNRLRDAAASVDDKIRRQALATASRAHLQHAGEPGAASTPPLLDLGEDFSGHPARSATQSNGLDLTALADMLRIDITASVREEFSAEVALARAEAASAAERAVRAEAAAAAALSASAAPDDGTVRTEWQGKVERAITLLNERIGANRATAAEAAEAAARALAATVSGGSSAASRREWESQVEAALARLSDKASNVPQAAVPTGAPQALADLQAQQQALQAAVAECAPRDKVTAALKRLQGEVVDAAARVSALETRPSVAAVEASVTAASVAALRDQATAASLLYSQLGAALEQQRRNAHATADELRAQLRAQAALIAALQAAAPPAVLTADAPGDMHEEDEQLEESLSPPSSPRGADPGSVPELRASLTALEVRVEALASDWGLGVLASQAASADAPAQARTLQDVSAAVLVLEARLGELATDWGMASLMSTQAHAQLLQRVTLLEGAAAASTPPQPDVSASAASQSEPALAARVADLEVALQSTPDVAAAVTILAPRVKALETALATLKAQLDAAAAAAAAAMCDALTPVQGEVEGLRREVAASASAALEASRGVCARLDAAESSLSALSEAVTAGLDDDRRMHERIDMLEDSSEAAREKLTAKWRDTETSVWQSIMVLREGTGARAGGAKAVGDGQATLVSSPPSVARGTPNRGGRVPATFE